MNGKENEEKLLILPLSDANSKKISQIFSNETSRKILEAVCDEPLSSTELSERLGVSLTTLHYNIENLLEAGLIKVNHTLYSEKGREVKFYSPTRKFIVIAPENIGKEEIKSTLKQFLFGVYFVAASAVTGYALQRAYYSLFTAPLPLPLPAPMEAAEESAQLASREAPEVVQAAPLMAQEEPSLLAWFFLGGIFALILLYLWQRVISPRLLRPAKVG